MNKGMQKLSRSIIVSTPLVCIRICISLSPLFHPMMSKKSVSFGMNHMIGSPSAVSPLTLINLTQPSRISRTETRATQANWSRSRVVWPAYNFHLSIVCTVSFIFDFVVEICIRKTGTITTFRFKPSM